MIAAKDVVVGKEYMHRLGRVKVLEINIETGWTKVEFIWTGMDPAHSSLVPGKVDWYHCDHLREPTPDDKPPEKLHKKTIIVNGMRGEWQRTLKGGKP